MQVSEQTACPQKQACVEKFIKIAEPDVLILNTVLLWRRSCKGQNIRQRFMFMKIEMCHQPKLQLPSLEIKIDSSCILKINILAFGTNPSPHFFFQLLPNVLASCNSVACKLVFLINRWIDGHIVDFLGLWEAMYGFPTFGSTLHSENYSTVAHSSVHFTVSSRVMFPLETFWFKRNREIDDFTDVMKQNEPMI